MARPKGVKDSKKRKPRDCIKTSQMVGKKFGRLTILSLTSQGHVAVYGIVKCDCGFQGEKNLYDIAYRKVVSCGCYHREEMSKRQIKPDNHSAKMKLFNSYKAGAKLRNHLFNLTFEQVLEISSQNCFYCDIKPNQIQKLKHTEYYYNGIDRIDNSKGYELSNCVPCCWDCNNKKGNITLDMIKRAYERIYANT